MSNKKLFLLDGHALVYRAHYAFITRPLINSKGINTSAISGFTRFLWDLIQNEKPSHIAVAFDLHGPTFRHAYYPEYKANRDAQPEDITIALPYIERIIKAFKIPIITLPTYEADDVIGTIAKQAARAGYTTFMVTPDKDYAQLVEEHILMYKPSRQGNGIDILGVADILKNWEIKRIDQVIDVLGLQGDAVDNIPGIPGVGEKTAVKLLADFDTIENIIANAKQLKGKLQERVVEFADQALLSKRLATIDINAPITFDENAYLIEPYDKEELVSLFKELEFRTLATSILGSTQHIPAGTQGDLFGDTNEIKSADVKAEKPEVAYSVAQKDITNTPHKYYCVQSEKDIKALIAQLEKIEAFSFDTETTGIDANQAELVGISFSFKAHEGYYVPIPSDSTKAKEILNQFKPILENPTKKLTGQNIKYDTLIMRWHGIELPIAHFDTMIAHYLCEPDLRHKLDILSENFLNYRMVPIEDLIGKGAKQISMRDVPIEKVSEYAAEDADVTLQIQSILEQKLEEQQMKNLFYDLEMPLVRVLTDMEYAGVRIDPDFLNAYSTVLGKYIQDAERLVHKKAGVPFNISSPKQVGDVLFDRLKIPYRWKKTGSEQFSTNEEKLAELSEEHEIVRDILEYRKLSKLKSTYVDSLPLMINPKTGRVHSSFNQARAATGRLSSENPNLQNIPIKDEAGREIRKAFIARDSEHIILAADYSQIELRLIAEISKDEAMLEAFIKGQDIHKATAARVYHVDYDAVSSDQRRNAKTVNFSIIYGAGATNISRQLGMNRNDAKALIDEYFKQYHGLRTYMQTTIESARKDGFVTTMLGRRRILRDINSRNALASSTSERVAVNTPIQGTAADMIKKAMLDIHKYLNTNRLNTKMIMQVHDELVFDVYKKELDEVKIMIEEKMRLAIPNLTVPIEVGIGIGENWLEAH